MSKNQTKNSAELILYGEIAEQTWWGDEVTPKQFVDDLYALGDVDHISVRINSPGGDSFAGLTIHSLLKQHAAKVTVYVDGLAASIASIIAMAGDKIIMPKGSMMMIHNPWMPVFSGNSDALRHMADLLDKVRDSLVDVYESKSKMDRDEIMDLLNKETWLSAAEAVKLGFADEVMDDFSISASLTGKTAFINGITVEWSKFVNAPELQTMQKVQDTKIDDSFRAKLEARKQELALLHLEV